MNIPSNFRISIIIMVLSTRLSIFLSILRPATTLESLAKLRPVFKKDGVVTAGNASVCI